MFTVWLLTFGSIPHDYFHSFLNPPFPRILCFWAVHPIHFKFHFVFSFCDLVSLVLHISEVVSYFPSSSLLISLNIMSSSAIKNITGSQSLNKKGRKTMRRGGFINRHWEAVMINLWSKKRSERRKEIYHFFLTSCNTGLHCAS